MKLEGLEETRDTARRELDALEDRRRRLADLERDRATLLEAYAEKASTGLDYFALEDRHQADKKLRLAVLVHPGGSLEASGILKRAELFVRNDITPTSFCRLRPRPDIRKTYPFR